MPPDDLATPYVAAFEDALAACLEIRYPGDDLVAQAARYAMSGGGKRVRPVLCLMAAEAVGADFRRALPAALALEFIHTYSLVHDDLPCMDDDDLRRGRATTHKVFGEANALLAGDALLTDAFALLADDTADAGVPATARLAQVRELAEAAGGAGMVLGQSLDLFWTSRPGSTRRDLDEMHLRKTGFLLGAATALGALAGGADAAVTGQLRAFGRLVGLAFQVLDDLLDDAVTTGKTRGKDQTAGKLTYLALMSPEAARRQADAHTAAALAQLAGAGARSETLRAYAQGLLARDR